MIQEILDRLLELQRRDLTLLQLKREAQGIPDRKAGLEAMIAEAAAAEQAAVQAVRACEGAIRQSELEATALREQIVRYRNQQMEVKTNESYRALEHEIEAAGARIAACEERELEEMERLETLRAGLTAARAALEEAKARRDAEQRRLDERMEVIRATFAEIKAEREALAAALPAEILERYMAQLQSKQDAVVVPIRNQSCGGCHMRLTPQQIHDAHALQKWVICPHCGRYLHD